MLLLIEGILTIVAWRKGWRNWALLPIEGRLIIGFMIGAFAYAMGIPESQLLNIPLVLLPIDLSAIGVLIVMCMKGRKRAIISYAKEISESMPAVKETA